MSRGSLFSCAVNPELSLLTSSVSSAVFTHCLFPLSGAKVNLPLNYSSPPPSPIQPPNHWDHVQCGLIQLSEKWCVNSLVSHRAHWTTATGALRPRGLKSATFDPWETLVHNNGSKQSGPSSVCPMRATVDCRSYNLSSIHHPLGTGPLLSITTAW